MIGQGEFSYLGDDRLCGLVGEDECEGTDLALTLVPGGAFIVVTAALIPTMPPTPEGVLAPLPPPLMLPLRLPEPLLTDGF